MVREAAMIVVAHGFDPAQQRLRLALEAAEPDPAAEGQILLGGVEDLRELAPNAARGEGEHRLPDLGEGCQEIAEQHDLAVARRSAERRVGKESVSTGRYR